MTKKEAKDYIREWCPYDEREEIIKALEQEPCEDAVSRQQFKIALLREYDIPHEVEHAPLNKGILLMKEKALEIAKDLPSVTPIRPKGAWTAIDEEPHETWECNHCGFVIDCSGCDNPTEYRDTFKFCPRCGTEMVKAESVEV